ncbi:hypothetical protein B0O99DRAFT_627928 [Bisporella sp. PMI_857]|nr:hypothetical protein B0O99DRAFT_627928 [Bisporella sp. PMI_857]
MRICTLKSRPSSHSSFSNSNIPSPVLKTDAKTTTNSKSCRAFLALADLMTLHCPFPTSTLSRIVKHANVQIGQRNMGVYFAFCFGMAPGPPFDEWSSACAGRLLGGESREEVFEGLLGGRSESPPIVWVLSLKHIFLFLMKRYCDGYCFWLLRRKL